MEVVYKELRKAYKNKIQTILYENLELLKQRDIEQTIPIKFICSVNRAIIPYIPNSPKTHFLSKTSQSLFTEDDPILRYVPSIRTAEPSQIEWFDDSSYGTKPFDRVDMSDLLFIRQYQRIGEQDKAIDFIKNTFGRKIADVETKKLKKCSLAMKDMFCSICCVFDCGIHQKLNPRIIRFDEKSTCICENPIMYKKPLKSLDQKTLELKPCIQRMILDMNQPCKNFKAPVIPKKKIVRTENIRNQRTFFEPCLGKRYTCGCIDKDMNCELFCGCQNCTNTPSCNCRICDENCPCFMGLRQCTILCRSHKKGEKLEKCENMLTFSDSQKKVSICKSVKHGLGLFSEEFIPANRFVIEYTGELITDKEAERRGNFYELNRTSYLFNSIFSEDYCLFSLDAYFLGNESRFINHSASNANLNSQLMISHGIVKIIFISQRDIYKGEEFLFDYGFQDVHKQKHGLID